MDIETKINKKKNTALVLTSSSGLRLAVAKALYREGHNVILNDFSMNH